MQAMNDKQIDSHLEEEELKIKLENLFNQRKMSYAKLEIKTDYSQEKLRSIIKGEVDPGINELNTMLKALGSSLIEIYRKRPL